MLNGAKNLLKQCILTDWVLMLSILKKELVSKCSIKQKEISKSLGAEYLRLFVVDINKPAIRLYQKNGFTKVDGVYDEVFDDGYVLREIGYEIKL